MVSKISHGELRFPVVASAHHALLQVASEVTQLGASDRVLLGGYSQGEISGKESALHVTMGTMGDTARHCQCWGNLGDPQVMN